MAFDPTSSTADFSPLSATSSPTVVISVASHFSYLTSASLRNHLQLVGQFKGEVARIKQAAKSLGFAPKSRYWYNQDYERNRRRNLAGARRVGFDSQDDGDGRAQAESGANI